jgi:shikimate kinase
MNERNPPIIITGFMASGKTTVAVALAERLGCSMIDLDEFIEQREGRTIRAIIDEDGETRFRAIESNALRDALETDGAHVIALGGGCWTIERNRALVHEHRCHTVWLDTLFELCWQRIQNGTDVRPLARDYSVARRLYDERRVHYSHAMLRMKVDDNLSAREIAEMIVSALVQQSKGSNG